MLWKEIEVASKQTGRPLRHVFQEEIQKSILTALSRKNLFNHLVFQGGTALRFFYGNPRFSEDLDFVIKEQGQPVDLTSYLPSITSFVKTINPFLTDVTLTVQKQEPTFQRLILTTSADQPIPHLAIHLEFSSVPSYQNQPRILDYPPFSPAIRVEKPEEILADKITALGLRTYIKGRDLWDIYYLITEHRLTVPWDLVLKKTKDYGSTIETMNTQLCNASLAIKKEGTQILKHELQRFLPNAILNQYEGSFSTIAQTVADLAAMLTKRKTP